MKHQMTIGTFNIRNAGADDGINIWNNRKGLVIESIMDKSPDIIGFQEALPYVNHFLEENLPQYTFVGNGRDVDLQGECNCIAYKKEFFELVSLETIWLSDTPYIPGSQFEGSDTCPRICTTVTLRSKINSQLFRVFNTHLDSRFPNIRLKQLSILNEFIEGYEKKGSLPTFLTGDLNCIPDSKEINYVLNHFKLNLEDISTVSQIKNDITFHGYYNDKENKAKIDYIFATQNVRFIKSYVDDTEKDGVYVSDHYPVYAEVEI